MNDTADSHYVKLQTVQDVFYNFGIYQKENPTVNWNRFEHSFGHSFWTTGPISTPFKPHIRTFQKNRFRSISDLYSFYSARKVENKSQILDRFFLDSYFGETNDIFEEIGPISFRISIFKKNSQTLDSQRRVKTLIRLQQIISHIF